jgi:radical S-adenosyl methionine domain-containing protein 2
MRKINFAGGEPFLYPSFLGDLVKFCKSELKLESVSIISNGSKIKAEWLEEFAPYLDILGISCDSFVEEINVKIGRGTGKHIENIFKVRELCHDYNIKFKLNTVVCKHNYMEDMNDYIKRLEPFRWKCFQVLVVKTENDGVSSQAIRDATEFLISKEQYEMFCEKHKNQPSFIKESNELMRSSYLILDEYMRFLDKGDDEKYVISESILNVDVEQALSQIKWDERSFHDRNGEYDWSRDNIDLADPAGAGDSICSDKKLEW